MHYLSSSAGFSISSCEKSKNPEATRCSSLLSFSRVVSLQVVPYRFSIRNHVRTPRFPGGSLLRSLCIYRTRGPQVFFRSLPRAFPVIFLLNSRAFLTVGFPRPVSFASNTPCIYCASRAIPLGFLFFLRAVPRVFGSWFLVWISLWFHSGPLQYTCLPCLWHRAFPWHLMVHFFVLNSTCFLFILRVFSFVFSCPFSVLRFLFFPRSPMCVLTYVTRTLFHRWDSFDLSLALWVSRALNSLLAQYATSFPFN